MNALEPIIASTREELARRRDRVPEAELEREAAGRAGELRPFAEALARPGLSVIAEHKRRSPSAGVIRADLRLEDVVGAYERGGAAALSVLTEGPSFGGSLDDLRAARATSALPILRKDFVVDAYQLHEALAAGADAILLIVAALEQSELERAAALGARLIGINNRDLTTLRVDIRRTFELLPGVPDGATVVAESGLRTAADLSELEDAGVDAVLIGEALMRSADIEAACRTLASANKTSL